MSPAPDLSEWIPEAYPQITAAFIPYTTTPQPRPDPRITVTQSGWLFIEVGNVRIALPDAEEWDKLVAMVSGLWAQWREVQEILSAVREETSPAGGPDEGDDPCPSRK